MWIKIKTTWGTKKPKLTSPAWKSHAETGKTETDRSVKAKRQVHTPACSYENKIGHKPKRNSKPQNSHWNPTPNIRISNCRINTIILRTQEKHKWNSNTIHRACGSQTPGPRHDSRPGIWRQGHFVTFRNNSNIRQNKIHHAIRTL